jgi:VWFA-related protein
MSLVSFGSPAWRSLCGLVVIAACGVAVPLTAQSDAVETFGEVIDVRVINLEAVVTGKSKKRVPGLTVDDFKLLVDGQEVEIDFFTELKEGASARDDAGGSTPGSVHEDDAAPKDRIATNYLIFIDNLFTVGGQRDAVLRRLAEQMSSFEPQDRMAITAFDGRRLEMLASWSDSQEVARQALLGAQRRGAEGALREADRRNPIDPRDDAGRLEKQINDVLTAAKISLRVAGRPEGRKVMLLLAGGWPYEILPPGPISVAGTTPGRFPGSPVGEGGPPMDPEAAATFSRLDSLNDFLRYDRGAELYQPLSDVANLLGYTLYPVDVPGVSSQPFGADVTMERSGSTIAALSRESENESSLRLLANETGGRALINDLRFEALERVVEDTRSYYWLGFQVDRQADDQRHEVELLPRDRRLKVRTRQSFTDLSRQTEARMATEEALIVDDLREPALVITSGEIADLPGKLMRVDLQIEIPVDSITILPAEDGFDVDLELTLAALDNRAAFWDLPAMPLQQHLSTEPPAGVIFRHSFAVTLRQGAQDVAVTVQDLPSGQMVTGRLRVEP